MHYVFLWKEIQVIFIFKITVKEGEGTNQEQASMDLQVQKITCISNMQTFPQAKRSKI